MKELIAVRQQEIGQQKINTVNARDLHVFLEAKKDFSSWIKDRIEKYGFQEGVDYVTISRSPIQGSGNRGASIDYHLTLDMAKELSMVERNEKGKQARLYFLECERVAQQQPTLDPIKVLNDPAAMRGLLLTYTERVISLEATVSEQAPKVAALDLISTADGALCITDTAKVLQMRPKDLFIWLSAIGWIFRRAGGSGWIAYQQRIQQGFLSHKVTTVERSDGSEKIVEQVLVTPKGVAKLADMRTKGVHNQMLVAEARA